MPPPKTHLPAAEAARIGEMSNRIDERAAEVERVATEFDDELYQLAIVRRRPIAAIARATGINEETMKKRVARIRRTRAAVQHHEAA